MLLSDIGVQWGALRFSVFGSGKTIPVPLLHTPMNVARIVTLATTAPRPAWIAKGLHRLCEGAAAANSAPTAEKVFASRLAGVDSNLLGPRYARDESGLLNTWGSRLKFSGTRSGEFGGEWHPRLAIGRNPLSPN